MNILDLIIIIIFIGAFFRGYQQGLIRQLVNLLGFFVAILLSYSFSDEVSPFLQTYIPLPTFENSTLHMFSQTFQLHYMFYNALAFLLIFLAAKLVLSFGGAILHQVANLPGLKIVNRLSGAVVGLLQGVLIIIIIIHIITVMPWQDLKQFVEGSMISNYLLDLTPKLTEMLYSLWDTSTM